MKRIVSIQDISCIGKCSLGVALPVLSAMGIECACLPTALLSAHTAFDGFHTHDLTSDFLPISAHWKALGLHFDAIYTGYLGAERQIELVQGFLSDFAAEDTRIFIDPVMADRGTLSSGIAPTFPDKMRELCRHADILTPNVTEACLLTGTEYRTHHDTAYVRSLLEKLLALGVGTAIITGIHPDDAHMGVAVMDKSGELRLHMAQYLPVVCMGTGDLFASVCVGALTRGLPAADAIALAADHVVETIRATTADPDARWYGVNFEATLPQLMTRLGLLPAQDTFRRGEP